ncbi:unnamed protein product [Cuscuta campestris]|uniref:RING-type E3 ubiquitin transferase n=1 Tax=Cuscuta campestris TaxID=132261 RepID=A0A484KGM2_9ASTE|nr:unnamed protein product [Cuscuta campestris]
MQGKRSAIGSLPETVDFSHAPSTGGDALGQPVCWNNLRNSAQNPMPDFVVNPNDSYINPTSNQERQNLISWSLGESSSSLQSSLISSSNVLSMSNFDVNLSSNPNSNSGISGINSDDDDDCQLLEFISTFEPEIPPNGRMPPVSSCSSGPLPEQNSRRSARLTSGQRLSRKRKAVEGDPGQSSGSGSSGSYFQPLESHVWQQHNVSSSSSIPSPLPNSHGVNLVDQMNPRLGLSIGLRETSRRNLRLRMNVANQLSSVPRSMPPPVEYGYGSASAAVSAYMNATRRRGQPLVGPTPTLPRHVESTSRGGESTHPVLTPGGPNFGAHLEESPTLARNRVVPQLPTHLSEFVRRSLPAPLRADPSHTPPIGQSFPEVPRSAMVLERPVDVSSSVPTSWRAFAAAGEGRRSRLISGIHNVLELMRRGEGLRVEDMMLLDPSVFFGMVGAQDRHRDMRLDVDNMSYEELLALEERIGNVCTGLSDEAILNNLKRRKYPCTASEDLVEREPCSICQEEYSGGDTLGTLDCGHEYHAECIKQWLKQKNLCPICKTTGLSTAAS